MSEDEQFNQAFGEHTGISKDIRKRINNVRQLARVEDFKLYFSQADHFTDLSWRLSGRYIANNNHLKNLVLGNCSVTDERMALLFSGLVESISVTKLWLLVMSSVLMDCGVWFHSCRTVQVYLKSPSTETTI